MLVYVINICTVTFRCNLDIMHILPLGYLLNCVQIILITVQYSVVLNTVTVMLFGS